MGQREDVLLGQDPAEGTFRGCQYIEILKGSRCQLFLDELGTQEVFEERNQSGASCLTPLHEKAKELVEKASGLVHRLAVHGPWGSRAITGRESGQSPAGSLSVSLWVSPKESSCDGLCHFPKIRNRVPDRVTKALFRSSRPHTRKEWQADT